jgi:hypothetical protein
MHLKVTGVVLGIFCLSLTAIPCWAQEELPAGQGQEQTPPFSFSLSLLFGYSSFGEDEAGEPLSYQKLGIFPEFSYGILGVALEFYLHFRFVEGELQVREEDWLPSGNKNFLDIVLSKIRYVRLAHKGDPLYLKLGSIDNNTLGNGYLMGNYSNTLFLPEKRIFGLNFDLDGRLFNFPFLGVETVVANLAALDVEGARIFIRPLSFLDTPVINMIELGTTFIIDRDPFKYVDRIYTASLGFSEDKEYLLTAFGIDSKLPLLTENPFTLSLFGDVAWLDDFEVMGGMVGLGGKIIDLFTYVAQVRINGRNFIPVYFDFTYDLSRADKYSLLKSGDIDPYLGWFAGLGIEIAKMLFFQVSLEGPFTEVAADYIKYPHLRAMLTLGMGVIPGLSINMIYDKAMLGKRDGFFADLFNPEDALTLLKINYALGPALITLFYELHYVPDAGTGEKKWQVTSGLECSLVLPL